jgi:hypothetical protein
MFSESSIQGFGCSGTRRCVACISIRRFEGSVAIAFKVSLFMWHAKSRYTRVRFRLVKYKDNVSVNKTTLYFISKRSHAFVW